jgi:hypothetical protein
MPLLDSATLSKAAEEWGPLHKFTPETYEEYENLPPWTRDKPKWSGNEGKLQYSAYWTSTIQSWVAQANARHGKWKDNCRKALIPRPRPRLRPR